MLTSAWVVQHALYSYISLINCLIKDPELRLLDCCTSVSMCNHASCSLSVLGIMGSELGRSWARLARATGLSMRFIF